MINFNNNTKKILLVSFCTTYSSICIGNGIYKSWNYLNDYELEKENYKTPYRKLEKACIGFGEGFMFGNIYAILSPVILAGGIISGIHTFYNSKK